MKLFNFRLSGWLILLPCLFISIGAFGAVSRHQCSTNDANIAGLQSLVVTVTNSADCAGSSYGFTSYTNTWIVGGCRGCNFLIDHGYGASVSGMTTGTGSNADKAFAKMSLQNGIYFSATRYNVVQDTNNSCHIVTDNTASTRQDTMVGMDKVELIYQTDGAWNQNLSAFVTSATVLAVFDEHGDIAFDVESLPADGKSKAHPRLTNPLAYPTNFSCGVFVEARTKKL
jgi:hypothetical protein